MKKSTSYNLYQNIFRENDFNNFQISYILSKSKNNATHYLAYAVSKDDPDDMICIKLTSNDSFEIHNVASWDFNIDDYFLSELENGYEIDFIPLEEHYNFWCVIDEWRDEISYQDGLQKYLSYCHINGISEHEIGLLQHGNINIMDLYQEKNAGYTIIAEMKCGERAIVLAERKSDIDPYVTWVTFVDRRRGFDMGHYFPDFKSAYQDFEVRSHSMMGNELNITKLKCRPKNFEKER